VDEQGKTVFLSSHLLGEVEQVCDRVAIIHRGEIVCEGPVADLLAGRSLLRVEASPLERALDVLRRDWTVTRNGSWLAVSADRDDAPLVAGRLVAEGIDLFQISNQRQTLEDFFLSVTQEEVDDAVQRG
jgi:ABC-2 type transport system ATP-binding protein